MFVTKKKLEEAIKRIESDNAKYRGKGWPFLAGAGVALGTYPWIEKYLSEKTGKKIRSIE